MNVEMRGAGAELLQALDALVGVVLDSGDGGHDGGGPEPVRDHGEVGEVSLRTGSGIRGRKWIYYLDAGVEQGLRPGVAQGTPVLVQEVHQLLADKSEIQSD